MPDDVELDRHIRAIQSAIYALMARHDIKFPWTIAAPGGIVTMTFEPKFDIGMLLAGHVRRYSTPPPERPDDGWDPVGERQPAITDLSKAPTFPAALCDGWDPNAPVSTTNHPSCEACDQGIAGAPCTCGDWESLSADE